MTPAEMRDIKKEMSQADREQQSTAERIEALTKYVQYLNDEVFEPFMKKKGELL